MENIKTPGVTITCLCKTGTPVRHLLDVVICPQCNRELRLSAESRDRLWTSYLRQNGPRQPMDIPLVQKSGPGDKDACQAIAAFMALKYFGINVTKEEFYERCETAGSGNHALSWGVLKGVASYGLYAWLISGNPYELNEYGDVMEKQGLTEHEAREKVERLIRECKSNEKIVFYENYEAEVIISRFVEAKAAVLIPTLDWTDYENHSVVVTNIWDGYVYFNNPNPDTLNRMATEEFLRSWQNEKTDYDIIVISDRNIDFEEINKRE